MGEESVGKVPFTDRVVTAAIVGLALLLIGFLLWRLPAWTHPRPPSYTVCLANLRQLALSLRMYADEHEGQYPPAERWCDVLADQYRQKTGKTAAQFRKSYRCPVVANDGWGYAMNPLANPKSDPNVVLVFESDTGWNGHGGPESLVIGRHPPQRSNVMFVSGAVRYVKAEEIPALRWDGKLHRKQEDMQPAMLGAGYRRSSEQPN